MDYVEQLQSLDETAGRQVIFDALNAAAMAALSDMKNEGTVKPGKREEEPDAYDTGYNHVGLGKPYNNIHKKDNLDEDTEQLDESVTVHVQSHSSKPDEKDTDHVKSGVEVHNGVYDGASDKGSYFKFKTEAEAKKFKSHVDKSPNKTTYADVLDESTQVDEARKIDQFENGIHKATVHKDSETGEYQVKFHTNGKHLKDADYFTDEKDDAIGTAKHQISKMKPDSGFANKVD